MPKFGSALDLMAVPAKNFSVQAGTAFPSSPFEGQHFRRSDQNKYYIYLGGGWQQCDNQGVAASTHIHAIADVTGLQAALDAKAPTANPTFTGTVTGVTKTHVGLGNVDNTSDAAKPVSTATQTALNLKSNTGHTHVKADITDLATATTTVSGLTTFSTDAEALTGSVTNKAVTPANLQAKINALVASAPGLLDTLDELAAALGDDPNFAATMTAALAGKASTSHVHDLNSVSITGILPITRGGTGIDAALGTYQILQAFNAMGANDSLLTTALVAGTWQSLFVQDAYHKSSAHRNRLVSFYEVSSGEEIHLDVRWETDNQIGIRSDVAFAANSLYYMVAG